MARANLIGHVRVSKRTWYARGGFRSNSCWRRQVRGVWHYYVDLSRF